MLQEDTAFGGPTAAASFLPLARVEVAQVGSVSSRDTLALLPPGRKGTQKLVVGDDSGQVKAYEVKRGEVSTAFGFDVGGLVRCVVVGMGEDGAPRDKIFATQGASIVGMDRKGREVYRLTSSSSELMTNVVVIGTTIYTCAEFTYNRYDDGVDAAFYMCQDKIMCMEVIRPWNSNEKKAVALGCLDRCIRIIHESDCVAKFSVDAPMRALTSCNGGVAYGTDAGSVGWLSPGTSTSIGESPFELSWCMPGTAAVTCMSTGQLRGGGAVLELLVGREDGTVEFYDLSAQVSTRQPPQVYADNLGDCVRSLAVGFVNSPTYSEALALTYGGRIVSFTTEPLNRVDASDKEGRTLGVLHSTNAMRQLRQDIKDLELKIAKEKEVIEKQRKASSSSSSTSTAPKEGYLPFVQSFEAITSCVLDAESAAYRICIQLPYPIELIILQSSLPLDLLESHEESQSSIVMTKSPVQPQTDPGPSGTPATLASCRCQGETNRAEIVFRTTEGDFGDIALTVSARVDPQMVAQVLRYKIKPLNLHCRLEDEFVPPEGHSMNTLRLTGSFNTNLIHEWVSARIPEVPPRIDSETARLSFQNKFTGSLLTCEYSKGNACFRSDSATTIAILRESFAREAASRRISLSDQLEVDQGSIAVFLERLYPKLDAQYLLVRQVSLINAIKEISAQDDQGAVWLSPEYRQILENADRIQKQHREQPQALQYIWGVITDLFVDWHRLNGRDVRSRLPEIQNFLLRRQDMNSLLTFFEGHF